MSFLTAFILVASASLALTALLAMEDRLFPNRRRNAHWWPV